MTKDPEIQTIKMSDLLQGVTDFFINYSKRWKTNMLLVIVGISFALIYGFIQKPNYEAEATFILEEKSGGMGGGLSGLASQFGFDISGLTGSSGLFAGDNILDILKSRTIVEKVLLSKVAEKSNVTLADLFKVAGGYNKKWSDDDRLLTLQFANYGTDSISKRLQDSVLFIFYEKLIDNHLDVDRLSKKGSIIKVVTKSKNETFSKLFTERLVTETMRLYVAIKTSVASKNIGRLEQRSDSLLALLNNKSYESAAVQILDANAAYKAASVPVELSQREKTVTYALYTEVMKNLETSRMALAGQTPVINLLDNPKYPLDNNLYPLWLLLLIGAAAGLVMSLSLFFVLYEPKR